MKKLLVTVLAGAMLLLAACGQKEKNVEGTLTEIMAKVYAGTENDMPDLMQTEVNDENKAYYFGTDDIEFKEALASEPMINAIAHSVVLVRLNEGQDAEQNQRDDHADKLLSRHFSAKSISLQFCTPLPIQF